MTLKDTLSVHGETVTVKTSWMRASEKNKRWECPLKEHSMIAYVDSVENIATENLQGFFVGWPNPPSPETHLKLLANSDQIVLAVDDETGNVVGFITAISDGILSAYITLFEVLPAYQRRGIGQEPMRRMLEKLNGLYMVDLFCDPQLQPFYARFGMKPGFGMMLRSYERQSAA